MKIARIINNDIEISNIYELYPNVSFPDVGIPDEFLQQNNLYKVIDFLSHDEQTQNYILLEHPVIKDNVVYTVEVTQKSVEEIRDYKLTKVRACRNQLLNASDIEVTIDKWEGYSQELKDSWKTYRQTLRDLPQNIQDFDNITWPIRPGISSNR